ncbi:MAG: hypothetical protein M1825_004079 [Sarcosagium campestre]|nr:MAG: hypothetical protein M1825_004079 [Sarcosagium campestre]
MVSPAVPEILEENIQSGVDARTDALQFLRELGPPDLVHLIKQSVKSSAKQTGSYHHVTGVDASSSASLAAYVNTLTYSPNDKSQKVVSGVYCCYNAFSRIDMRVQVTIPGSVESYCLDERGDRRTANDQLWLETYLSAVLRAYSYADDGGGDTIKKIIAVRRFNPITTTESEHKFLDAAEQLFFKGWQLGSEPEIQVPSLVSNLLTKGILDYIRTTGRYASGINLFEKLRTRDVEVSSLLVRVLIAADEEVRAISLAHEAIQELPMDYSLLDVEATFCKSKGRGDLALECAKRSVTAAPSEFGTWARLAEIYVHLEQWELALLTLNSCPMFTYQDKDAPRMPEPSSRVVLPVLQDTLCDEINDDTTGDAESVHPTLRKLQAAGYRGTFLKAYNLLTEITAKIGWDQLLKIRSNVFVMEEEYRNEKHGGTSQRGHGSRNASTTAIRGGSSSNVNGVAHDENSDEKDDEESDGGDGAREQEAGSGEGSDDERDRSSVVTGTTAVDPHPAETGIEKPEHTVTSEVAKSGNEDYGKQHVAGNSNYAQFRNKRLCERWLDNLFMVHYEDLRVYTIWQTELAQYRQQNRQYHKSAEEWEILGELALRLHHDDEAFEAFECCLDHRFSPKAMKGILKLHEREGNTKGMLDTLIRLIGWQYRWYSEFSPSLLYTIRNLIEDEGAVKIRSTIQAMTLPQPLLDLAHHYAALCAAFRSTGSDI